MQPRPSLTRRSMHRYHLKDVIVGKIYFLLVRIKIKYMELAIIKRETTGSGMDSITVQTAKYADCLGPNVYHESETVTKFEIMDGAPVKGRLMHDSQDLTHPRAQESRFPSASSSPASS